MDKGYFIVHIEKLTMSEMRLDFLSGFIYQHDSKNNLCIAVMEYERLRLARMKVYRKSKDEVEVRFIEL